MLLGPDTGYMRFDRDDRRRQTVNTHGLKDTLSDGILHPGRAFLIVAGLTLVAMALRAI